MPSTPATQNNPDIVDGPRKRRPSERVTENGDPHSHKKAKTTASATQNPRNKPAAKNNVTRPTPVNRQASVEDVPEPAPAPRPQPHHPARILESSDGSDDGVETTGMPGLIELDDDDDDNSEDEGDEPEDDEAELGKCKSMVSANL